MEGVVFHPCSFAGFFFPSNTNCGKPDESHGNGYSKFLG